MSVDYGSLDHSGNEGILEALKLIFLIYVCRVGST
jgi:hypothetical protein